MRMTDIRNKIAHSYGEEVAERLWGKLSEFLLNFQKLLDTATRVASGWCMDFLCGIMSLVDNFSIERSSKSLCLKKFGIRKSNLKGGDEMQKRKGFTLIELLVVIAIIGLLATIAVIALNSARVSSRDAKRVADIKEVQTGLELYFNASNSYPSCTSATTLSGLSSSGGCVATNIKTYLAGIDNIKDPLKPGTACTSGGENCDYGYAINGSFANTGYYIYFYLEAPAGSLLKGGRTASPSGIL